MDRQTLRGKTQRYNRKDAAGMGQPAQRVRTQADTRQTRRLNLLQRDWSHVIAEASRPATLKDCPQLIARQTTTGYPKLITDHRMERFIRPLLDRQAGQVLPRRLNALLQPRQTRLQPAVHGVVSLPARRSCMAGRCDRRNQGLHAQGRTTAPQVAAFDAQRVVRQP